MLWPMQPGGSSPLLCGFASPSASGSSAGLLTSGQQTGKGNAWKVVRKVWGGPGHIPLARTWSLGHKGVWKVSSCDLGKKSQNAVVAGRQCLAQGAGGNFSQIASCSLKPHLECGERSMFVAPPGLSVPCFSWGPSEVVGAEQ